MVSREANPIHNKILPVLLQNIAPEDNTQQVHMVSHEVNTSHVIRYLCPHAESHLGRQLVLLQGDLGIYKLSISDANTLTRSCMLKVVGILQTPAGSRHL